MRLATCISQLQALNEINNTTQSKWFPAVFHHHVGSTKAEAENAPGLGDFLDVKTDNSSDLEKLLGS